MSPPWVVWFASLRGEEAKVIHSQCLSYIEMQKYICVPSFADNPILLGYHDDDVDYGNVCNSAENLHAPELIDSSCLTQKITMTKKKE